MARSRSSSPTHLPSARGRRRRELDIYLETWRAHHPGLELEPLH